MIGTGQTATALTAIAGTAVTMIITDKCGEPGFFPARCFAAIHQGDDSLFQALERLCQPF
jgi:hypothetical protein